MLVEAVNEVEEMGGDPRTLRLYGQEVNLTTAAIARMNLFMHDIEDFKILRGDTLRDPKFKTTKGALTRFDVVLANPPFSLKNWGAEAWARDPYKRSFCGVPPSTNADFAWIQHMVASMRPKSGRVGVVMPHGVLFRGGQEKEIRECIVKSGHLAAVVGLPPNLFYSTTIPAALLILSAASADAEGEHVLFIDGSRAFTKGRNQNLMTDQDVEEILAAYKSASDGDLVGRVSRRLVSVGEIKENDWDLNIGRYMKNDVAAEADVPSALAAVQAAEAQFQKSRDALHAALKAAGYE